MKYIDVTLTYEPGMRGVEIEPAKVLTKDGWNARTLHLYSHAGTHMDAPVHFGVNEKSIELTDPARYFVSCYVVDLPDIKPRSEIKVADVDNIAGLLQKGEGLIFRTGWSRLVNKPLYREGLPAISKELAEWCVKKEISFIGVEPPSVADVNNLEQLTMIHRILLNADILIVEGLVNLEQITKPKVQVVALPLKIKNGDGAPCRVIVIED